MLNRLQAKFIYGFVLHNLNLFVGKFIINLGYTRKFTLIMMVSFAERILLCQLTIFDFNLKMKINNHSIVTPHLY